MLNVEGLLCYASIYESIKVFIKYFSFLDVYAGITRANKFMKERVVNIYISNTSIDARTPLSRRNYSILAALTDYLIRIQRDRILILDLFEMQQMFRSIRSEYFARNWDIYSQQSGGEARKYIP